jgi:hypothetical protein
VKIMSFDLDLAIETDLSSMNWKRMPTVSTTGRKLKGEWDITQMDSYRTFLIFFLSYPPVTWK